MSSSINFYVMGEVKKKKKVKLGILKSQGQSILNLEIILCFAVPIVNNYFKIVKSSNILYYNSFHSGKKKKTKYLCHGKNNS